jgi:2-phosphoglycerate kinase
MQNLQSKTFELLGNQAIKTALEDENIPEETRNILKSSVANALEQSIYATYENLDERTKQEIADIGDYAMGASIVVPEAKGILNVAKGGMNLAKQ